MTLSGEELLQNRRECVAATGQPCSDWTRQQCEAYILGYNLGEYRAQMRKGLGKVKIEVLGGVAECTEQTDNIEVEIIDHDNEDAA